MKTFLFSPGEYEGDKVDIWGLGCILYILLYGSSPFMQMNDSETLIKILDCSFTTPQRPNVNENAVDLIRSLLRKDPKSRLTIRQILEHPWLREESQQPSSPTTAAADQHASPVASQTEIKENELEEEPVFKQTVLDDEMAELRKKLSSVESYDKSRNFDEQLHDSVIEQMLTKGMCNSKEQVENAIKCSRKIANASKHEIVKKIIPNKEELANDQPTGCPVEDDKNARDCYNTDNKLINQHLEEHSTLTEKEDREKAYLTATYNLIKDKISREQQGIHLTNQVQSKLMHHKKVLPTRPRKSIIKQPQFGLASSAGSGGISRPDSAGSCELNESAEEQQRFNDLMVNKAVAELPVYEEDSNGLFMLPLARKCSIVSEEGSCIANSDYSGNEYSSDINSGHNSIGNYNSLNDYSLNAELNKVRSHSYLNNQSNSSSKRNSRENLKIQSMPLVNIVITDFSNTIEEDERLEIDEFNNCTVKNEQGTTVCQSVDDQEHRKSGYFCATPASLHQASSSPDLGREEKLSEQKSDLVISKEDEDANQFDEHVISQLNQLNQTASGKGSLHTSMRVIMQSKSCNNILCSGPNGKDEHCSDCELAKQDEQKQQADQLSSQEPAKDQLSTTGSNNVSLFGRFIGKRLQSQKDDGSSTKRLSLNLEPEEALAAKDKLNASSGSPAFKECKPTDKINCCAVS